MKMRVKIVYLLAVMLLAACSRSSKVDEKSSDPTATPVPSPSKSSTDRKDNNKFLPTQTPLPFDVLEKRTKNKMVSIVGSSREVSSSNILQAWNAFYVTSLKEPLKTVDEAVINGRTLPIDDLTKTPIIQQLKSNHIETVTSDDEREALIGLYSIALSDCMSGGNNLPRLLLTTCNDLPPTRGDVLLLHIVSETLSAVEPKRVDLSPDEIQLWSELCRSRNPIYRYISLNAISRIMRDVPMQLDLLRQFHNENDDTILRCLVDQLTRLPQKAGVKQLEELHNQFIQNKNQALVDYVTESEKLIQ